MPTAQNNGRQKVDKDDVSNHSIPGKWRIYLDKRHTVSTFPVQGNMSTQQARSTLYPFAKNASRSLARLVGLQEI